MSRAAQSSTEWKGLGGEHGAEVAVPRKKRYRAKGLGGKVQVRMVDPAEARRRQPLWWHLGVWTSRFDLGVGRITQATAVNDPGKRGSSWPCS